MYIQHGIKPFAINEMTMMAYYKVDFMKTSMLVFPENEF
jgi:hypothetical protein